MNTKKLRQLSTSLARQFPAVAALLLCAGVATAQGLRSADGLGLPALPGQPAPATARSGPPPASPDALMAWERQDMGVPAIRFSVGIENYDHQHQDLRTEKGVVYGDTIEFMDFAYLAKVTALNIAMLDRLARAPMPPPVSVEAAVQTFTTVKWTASPGATAYTLWQRRTDAPGWTRVRRVDAKTTELKLPGIRGDDWFFGVSAVAADGSESPISSGVPGGGFYRPAH